MPPLDYHSLINVHHSERIIHPVLFAAGGNKEKITLGSGFGSKGEVPSVTWYVSGWDGDLHGDGGLGWRRFLCGGVGLSGGVGAEVGKRKVGGSHVVDSQQDLHGADLLETLIHQRQAGLLDLLDTRRERTHPTSWRQERERERIDVERLTARSPKILKTSRLSKIDLHMCN